MAAWAPEEASTSRGLSRDSGSCAAQIRQPSVSPLAQRGRPHRGGKTNQRGRWAHWHDQASPGRREEGDGETQDVTTHPAKGERWGQGDGGVGLEGGRATRWMRGCCSVRERGRQSRGATCFL